MDPATRGTANEILSAWRTRVEGGENLVIEDLCAEHPELAEALRHLHADWILEGSRPPSTEPPVRLLSAQLRALFGEGIDPGICLDDQENAASKLRPLDDLRSRGPDSTRYDVRDKVGQGGMGAVYRVFDHDLKRTLAMKVALDRDPARLARFLEEAQVNSQLDHPCIVPVHELSVDAAGSVFFTMKLVRGETLDAIFDKLHSNTDGWNVTRALGVLLRIAEAMAFAHEKRVIHRDLKPGNVMVGRHGEVYVMDWGLARVLDDPRDKPKSLIPSDDDSYIATRRTHSTSTDRGDFYATRDGDIVGTPAYMSPEQAFGKLDVLGPQTDVYALGAILYRLLAGQSPYSDSVSPTAGFEIVRRIVDGPPTPLEELAPHAPPELHAICEKAMARELHVRYDSMAAFGNDLRAYLENRVVTAYESGAVAEFKKWVRRNRGLALAASLALAVTFAGLVAVGSIEKKRRIDVEAQKSAVEVQRAEAIARKTEFDQLAGVVQLEEALERADTLHPAWPEQIPRIETWLVSDAQPLVALRPVIATTLRSLASRADSAEQQSSAQFLSRTLEDLSTRLEEFERITVPAMRRRLDWAQRIESLTLAHPNARVTWAAARDAIAKADDVVASQLYSLTPIDLAPQMGLVPIGMNPATRLWEFLDLRSACDFAAGQDPASIVLPTHDSEGRIEMTAESGIVLVLVPGGSFLQGSQRNDASAPRYDPGAYPDQSVSGRPVEVTLAPYFISKYEATQGQWLRLTGSNPSFWMSQFPQLTGLDRPVERTSWEDCRRVLPQFGLWLPTESQWEYAARAGTGTVFSFGDDLAEMWRHGNVRDATFARTIMNTDPASCDTFDDGQAIPTIVGSYRPNGFGLHDVHGNVMELCADRFGSYETPARAGDALRDPPDSTNVVFRGGGCYEIALSATVARRPRCTPQNRDDLLGFRPARALR